MLSERRTRRSLLALAGGGAAAASGAALAACGGGESSSPAAPSREAQAATLNSALAFEHAVVVAYEAGARLLRGSERRVLRELIERERGYARRLAREVRALGVEPAEPRGREEYARGFPAMRDGRDALTFAADLEERSVRKYLEALPRLPQPGLRRLAAEIAVDQARHLALLRSLLGEPPAPTAFVTGLA